MLRAAPALAIFLLSAPVLFGLGATLLPAFGYFPALGGKAVSLEPFAALFAEPGIWRSCFLAFYVGLCTTFVALAIVIGFVAGWAHTRAFQVIQHLLSPLLSVPHAAAAFGLAFLLAPSGWLLRLVSPGLTGFSRPPDWLIVNDPYCLSMMAGLLVKELPFLFLVTLAALPQANPRDHSRIAASLGYGRIAGFLHAVWPRIYPQIRLAVFAVIAYAGSVVDVAIILGPTNPAPLAVRLVAWMNDPDLVMRFKASAGAAMQLGVTLVSILVWVLGERLLGWLFAGIGHSGRRFRSDGPIRSMFAGLVVLCAGAVFAGLSILAVWSVAGQWPFPDALPGQITLQNWERQLPGMGRPFLITVGAGLAAAALAVALALACLEREARVGRTGGSRALAILYLPLIVPQISFVFGLQLFFLVAGIGPSFLGLVMVHLVFVLPYVFLSLSDPWRAFDRRFIAVARSVGASDNRIFWTVRAPMLLRPVLVAGAVGFAVSVGLYLPTLLIGGGRLSTITTEAVALASGGDRRVIGVYAFLQMLLPFTGFLLATLVPAMVFVRRRGMRAAT